MNIQNYFKKIIILTFLVAFSVVWGKAQNYPEPRQEKLLNGLKLLVFNDVKAEKITIKIRIHSGSAFDPKDKTGVMALLGDIFFPDPQTKLFFEEDLEGSLQVEGNYDFLQITATGKSDEFLTILETLAIGVTNPQITQENFVKVRDERIKVLTEKLKNPEYLASSAVAKRLFGEYPYGRPTSGTLESLKLIDKVDLIFARERFLTADNATLTISGNVNFNLAQRASKRFFGAWKKSEKLVPATFRQPEPPEPKVQQLEFANLDNSYSLKAKSAVGRTHPDYYAMEILARLHQKVYCQNSFRYQAFLLRGMAIIGTVSRNGEESNPVSMPCETAFEKDGKIVSRDFKQSEFDAIKAELFTFLQQKAVSDWWLDVDTYRLISVKDEFQKLTNVTLADVNRLEKQLSGEPTAEVLITKKTEEKTGN